MYKTMTWKYLPLVLAIFLAAGCAKNTDGTWKAPFVYRIDIQQGNIVDQSMISKLQPGMNKEQVRFVMGTPLLVDPFHSDRWEYIYSFEPGRGERQQRHITLHFRDDKLAYVSGDIEVSNIPINPEDIEKEKTVVVPIGEYKEGIFSRMWSGLTGDDEESGAEAATTTDETGGEPAETSGETALAEEPQAPAPGDQAVAAPGDEDTDAVSETETAVDPEAEKIVAGKTPAGDTEQKGLLRRFWDRMTTSTEDSAESGEETERDIRDAEVFEGVGGSF